MDIWDLFGYFIFLMLFMLSFVLSFYIVIYFCHNKETDYTKKGLISILMVTGTMIAIFTNFLMVMDIISHAEK